MVIKRNMRILVDTYTMLWGSERCNNSCILLRQGGGDKVQSPYASTAFVFNNELVFSCFLRLLPTFAWLLNQTSPALYRRLESSMLCYVPIVTNQKTYPANHSIACERSVWLKNFPRTKGFDIATGEEGGRNWPISNENTNYRFF